MILKKEEEIPKESSTERMDGRKEREGWRDGSF